MEAFGCFKLMPPVVSVSIAAITDEETVIEKPRGCFMLLSLGVSAVLRNC
jgi:hypothetical protein